MPTKRLDHYIDIGGDRIPPQVVAVTPTADSGSSAIHLQSTKEGKPAPLETEACHVCKYV